MKRRNVLKHLTLAAGGSLVIPTTLFYSCQSEGYQPFFFTKKNLVLLNEIGETILPETVGSPGAKALKIANFMDVYVADCYEVEQQKIIQEGLIKFQKDCQEKEGKSFLKMTTPQRHEWLVALDKSAKDSESTHYFTLLKRLILMSYFTAKDGAIKALRYLPIPGKFDGDYPFQQGDKSWALG